MAFFSSLKLDIHCQSLSLSFDLKNAMVTDMLLPDRIHQVEVCFHDLSINSKQDVPRLNAGAPGIRAGYYFPDKEPAAG